MFQNSQQKVLSKVQCIFQKWKCLASGEDFLILDGLLHSWMWLDFTSMSKNSSHFWRPPDHNVDQLLLLPKYCPLSSLCVFRVCTERTHAPFLYDQCTLELYLCAKIIQLKSLELRSQDLRSILTNGNGLNLVYSWSDLVILTSIIFSGNIFTGICSQ